MGGNDIGKPSECLKEKFRLLFAKLKEKRSPVIINGIYPRLNESAEWTSRTMALNKWLNGMCTSSGMIFLDNWNYLTKNPHLYARDGVHLNFSGKECIIEHICELLEEKSVWKHFLAV